MRVSKVDVDIFGNWAQDEKHYTMEQRQELAKEYLKKSGRITNWDYVKLCGVGYRTAHRDLADLKRKGDVQIFKMGRNTYYALQQKNSEVQVESF